MTHLRFHLQRALLSATLALLWGATASAEQNGFICRVEFSRGYLSEDTLWRDHQFLSFGDTWFVKPLSSEDTRKLGLRSNYPWAVFSLIQAKAASPDYLCEETRRHDTFQCSGSVGTFLFNRQSKKFVFYDFAGLLNDGGTKANFDAGNCEALP